MKMQTTQKAALALVLLGMFSRGCNATGAWVGGAVGTVTSLAISFGWNLGSWTANFAWERAFENTQTPSVSRTAPDPRTISHCQPGAMSPR